MYKVLFLLPLMGCLSETATGLTAFNLSRDSDEVEEPVDSERRSLMLEARDGSGGFRIRVRDLTGGNGHKDYWQSDLSCASQGVASEETTGGLTEYWLDCTHNDFDGRVSLAANFTPQTDDENHVEVWLDNQLVGASITNAMYLMRINGASYPEKGEDLKARFLVEEWISNPMVQMRESGEMTTRAGHLPICDNATPRNCVWKNRNKGTPAMSLHTPDWGMLLHTMDPDNADSGYLVLGGAVNEELESRLDFGYEAQLSNTDVEANGGGLIRISPVLSARTLPAELPLNDAWWEALEVYRDYVENETNLLPEVPLTQSPTFAPWSETCVYNALYVLDEHGNVKVDDIAQFFDEMMAFYAEPGDPVDICPLLWAALSDAPYAFKPGTQELIDALHTAADRYPNVEVHPVFYVNNACADPSFDVPASAWTLYNNKHWICHDGTSWTIDPSVKEVSDALRAILPVAFEMGFEGVYHDAPFGDYIVPDTGGDRRFGVASLMATCSRIRTNIAPSRLRSGFAGQSRAKKPPLGHFFHSRWISRILMGHEDRETKKV